MKASLTKLVLAILLAFFLSLGAVFAAQSFNINPTTLTQDVDAGQSESGVILVSNTGNESITVTATANAINRDAGADSMSFTLNTTSITLAENQSQNLAFNYSADGTQLAGAYTGTVVFANSANTSQASTFTLSTTVNNENPPGVDIELANGIEDGEVFFMNGDVDERATDDIRFRNTGDVDLNNIRIDITDLEGLTTDEEIPEEEVDFEENGFDLEEGDSIRFEIEIDIPDDIGPDTYEAIMTLTSDEGLNEEFILRIEVSADDLDVFIRENDADVRDGILVLVGEPGELVDDFEFTVENDGNVNLQDISFRLDDDLEEEFSGNTIPESAVSFVPSVIDLDGGDSEDIEVRVSIPEGQATGDYFGEIEVFSIASGERLDEIAFEVRVIGDVFIRSIDFDGEVEPGDNLDVTVTIKNQASRVQRNVQLRGTIEDIDSANSDLTETTNTFLLNVKEEKEVTLRFRIPDDATDGSHTMELELEFGDETITELEQINVVRPERSIDIQSFVLNPAVAICDDSIFTFVKLENLGRFDEDIRLSVEIEGTALKTDSDTFELEVDELVQRNLALDISSLEPGTYTVVQKVFFGSSSTFNKREAILQVHECRTGTGVDVNPIDIPDNVTGNQSGEGPFTLFGQEVERSTVYIGSAVVTVFVLIGIALFFV